MPKRLNESVHFNASSAFRILGYPVQLARDGCSTWSPRYNRARERKRGIDCLCRCLRARGRQCWSLPRTLLHGQSDITPNSPRSAGLCDLWNFFAETPSKANNPTPTSPYLHPTAPPTESIEGDSTRANVLQLQKAVHRHVVPWTSRAAIRARHLHSLGSAGCWMRHCQDGMASVCGSSHCSPRWLEILQQWYEGYGMHHKFQRSN